MSKYAINSSTLTAIGDAIRAKNGTTDTYKPTDMAAAIEAIVGGGGGSVKYVQLTNSDGAKASQVFDASAYIGTDDDREFFIVAWSCYGNTNNAAVACTPNILYYDGKGTYTDILTSANSLNVSYYITPANCKLEAGVITLTRNGSTYFQLNSSTSSTTNYLELFYCDGTGGGTGGGGGPEFVVTNGELVENFYSEDGADIEPFTFVEYFEGGLRTPVIKSGSTYTAGNTDGIEGTKIYPWYEGAYILASCSTTSRTLKLKKLTVTKEAASVSTNSDVTFGGNYSGEIHSIVKLSNSYVGVLYGDNSGNIKCSIFNGSSKYSEITLATGAYNKSASRQVALGFEPESKTLFAFYQQGDYNFAIHPITWNGSTSLTAGTAMTWTPNNVTVGSYSMIHRAEFFPSTVSGRVLLVVDGNIGASSTAYKQFHDVVTVTPSAIEQTKSMTSVTSNKFVYGAVTVPVEEGKYLHFWDTEANENINACIINGHGTVEGTTNFATNSTSMQRVLDATKIGDGLVAVVFASSNSAINFLICTYDLDLASIKESTATSNYGTVSILTQHFGTFLTPVGDNRFFWVYQDRNGYLYYRDVVFADDGNITSSSATAIVSADTDVPLPKYHKIGVEMNPVEGERFIMPYFKSTSLYFWVGAYWPKSTVSTLDTTLAATVANSKLGITKTACGVEAPGAIYKYTT